MPVCTTLLHFFRQKRIWLLQVDAEDENLILLALTKEKPKLDQPRFSTLPPNNLDNHDLPHSIFLKFIPYYHVQAGPNIRPGGGGGGVASVIGRLARETHRESKKQSSLIQSTPETRLLQERITRIDRHKRCDSHDVWTTLSEAQSVSATSHTRLGDKR